MCKGEMAQLDSCLIAPMALLVNHFVGEMVNQTFSNDITDFQNSKYHGLSEIRNDISIILLKVNTKILLLASLVWTTADLLWYFPTL